MLYQNVSLEAIAYTLPEEIVTSDELETRLEPLYTRLKLPQGRLELMTGIRERRFWPHGMLPGEKSVETGLKAIGKSGIPTEKFGCLVHGSVCRDYLEPATASGVHHGLGLPRNCVVYDVSNACLGILNGAVQIANMIELGEIDAGIVVGTESARALVETTVEQLNRDMSLTRNSSKNSLASLTIGSGSAAIVLCHKKISRSGIKLVGGSIRANTDQCHLCRSGRDESADAGMKPLMATDAETLMHEGIAVGRECFELFLKRLNWSREQIDRTFCHQVGKMHQRMMLEQFGLDPAKDFTTYEFLGNTGTTALPMTAALGIEKGFFEPGQKAALLGIGSGINVVMLGLDWEKT